MKSYQKVVLLFIIYLLLKNPNLKSDFQNSKFEILSLCTVSMENLVTFDLSDRPYSIIVLEK